MAKSYRPKSDLVKTLRQAQSGGRQKRPNPVKSILGLLFGTMRYCNRIAAVGGEKKNAMEANIHLFNDD